MLRRIAVVAVLALSFIAVQPTPAPAIDYICSCTLCTPTSSLGCRNMKNGGRFTSCSTYYATYC
ncbi:MAG TPA: hypothetical protein VLQ45_15890 [Thermoanaerobaculia bacterium]|nr:hypothetical protein [Thermoanaerobaculia bacterium]